MRFLLFILALIFVAPHGSIADNFEKFKLVLKTRFLTGQPFTEIVTLGLNCYPKFRTGSYLQRHKNSNLRNGNYIFDWVQILNYTLLGEAIKNNVSDVFNEDSLMVKSNYLYNSKYAMNFIHVYDGRKNFKLTSTSFHDTYHTISDKYRYLISRTQEALKMDKKTIYVVFTTGDGSKPSDFINLLHSIKTQRNNNFLLLVLVGKYSAPINNFPFDTIIEENLCFHEVVHYPLKEWFRKPSIDQWDRIMNVFSLANNKP